jgi:glycosyltransferase involved in cell wall biosynthesis
VRARTSFDVAVVRGTRVLGVPALLAARWAGRPLVLQPEISGEMSGAIYTWGTRWHRPPFTTLLGLLTRLRNRWLRDADAYVTISERTQAEFLEAGLDPRRLVCIPHGVDTQRFTPAARDERARLRAALRSSTCSPAACCAARVSTRWSAPSNAWPPACPRRNS